ncbi:hypothetical protein AOQ84DRAFT_408982 [Glonium stellatum]|uniref:Uncharacterized protein n=1 Tax=Glonium stellatum TaxID=574774 RepID=A0A8E2EYX9_9PEZI|nr:hypothetical protein AOQ84DRAFT_408982 [Glonium stellatum]
MNQTLESLVPSASASASLETLAPQARLTFQDAFARFEQTVQKFSIEDSHRFQSTSLEDVRSAAKEIERQLAARQCLRNMRRIQPFLDGLERYSKVIEVLCNGTPYLPWIWAPIKLMLQYQLATDFTAAFEKLISAYGQIAENLPRFDRLSHTFNNNPDFQRILAIVYADILDFHHWWKCFFNSSWRRFDARFKCILESLAKHTDMVDREANSLAITEAKEWRQRAIQEAAKRGMEQSAVQVQSVISWLGDSAAKQDQQDDLLDRLLSSCYPETSEWISGNSKVKMWLKNQPTQSLLWLKGKPGSGKSLICQLKEKLADVT